MIKRKLRKIIVEAIQHSYPQYGGTVFNLSTPPPGIDADLCSNAALSIATALKDSPLKVAGRLAQKIGHSEIVKEVSVSKNGFLNFIFQNRYLETLLRRICSENEKLGRGSCGSGSAPILLEFVSANPTGPLHIGHGRGAALGDSFARIYRQLGEQVETEYYVNDRGIQMEILANSVEAKFRQMQGQSDVAFPENGYKGSYIEGLARLMLEKKSSDFDRFPREHLLQQIKKDLEDFGVSFDHWFYESDLYERKKIEEVLKILSSRDVLKEKDGALWYGGPASTVGMPLRQSADEAGKSEPDKERVLRKSDGKFTYFASDIAYHKEKFDRGFRECVNIWGQDHHGYVPRVQSAVSLIGGEKNSLKILLYQLVALKRGGKRVAMSTRSGEFVTLREILDEVGRDACRFFFAMRTPDAQLEFDLDLAKKQSNENPVYYVQYVHARICSIFREAKKRGIEMDLAEVSSTTEGEGRNGAAALLTHSEERELMLTLGFFADALDACRQFYSLNILTNYLLDLSAKFHRFYDRHRVLDAPPQLRSARLTLLRSTRIVVKLALSLLGVSAPEEMRTDCY